MRQMQFPWYHGLTGEDWQAFLSKVYFWAQADIDVASTYGFWKLKFTWLRLIGSWLNALLIQKSKVIFAMNI